MLLKQFILYICHDRFVKSSRRCINSYQLSAFISAFIDFLFCCYPTHFISFHPIIIISGVLRKAGKLKSFILGILKDKLI